MSAFREDNGCKSEQEKLQSSIRTTLSLEGLSNIGSALLRSFGWRPPEVLPSVNYPVIQFSFFKVESHFFVTSIMLERVIQKIRSNTFKMVR